MDENRITSLQNNKIKRLVLLQQKSAERRRCGLFVVEGQRELYHCIEAGYEVEQIFVSENFVPSSDSLGGIPLSLFNTFKTNAVTAQVYERIAYRGSTEGIVGIIKSKTLQLQDVQLGENPLLMILERVEKPGNLGAVLRSADAAHADAVIVCDPLTDLYNPNLIRASLGAVFSVPVLTCSSDNCITFLKQKGIQILTAQLQDSRLYYDTPMTGPTAIVMGTESTGLTDQWRIAADAHIRIPMLGRLDSLNVSVSAAILLFEAVRQRTLMQ